MEKLGMKRIFLSTCIFSVFIANICASINGYFAKNYKTEDKKNMFQFTCFNRCGNYTSKTFETDLFANEKTYKAKITSECFNDIAEFTIVFHSDDFTVKDSNDLSFVDDGNKFLFVASKKLIGVSEESIVPEIIVKFETKNASKLLVDHSWIQKRKISNLFPVCIKNDFTQDIAGNKTDVKESGITYLNIEFPGSQDGDLYVVFVNEDGSFFKIPIKNDKKPFLSNMVLGIIFISAFIILVGILFYFFYYKKRSNK